MKSGQRGHCAVLIPTALVASGRPISAVDAARPEIGGPMARSRDLAIGVVLGAAAMTVLVAVAADSPAADPVKISPQDYTVRLENDRVRVLEWTLQPGGKEPMHSHPDGVLITLAASTLRSTTLHGTATTVTTVKDQVNWAPAVSHSIENVGNTEAHAVLVELKSGTK